MRGGRQGFRGRTVGFVSNEPDNLRPATPPVNAAGRALQSWDELKDEAGAVKLQPAHVYANQRDWPGYFAAVASAPARETLVAAIEAAGAAGAVTSDEGEAGGAGSPPLAIDVGCGEGRDTIALLRAGYRVLAIDGHPAAFERLESRPDLTAELRGRLTVRLAALEGLELARGAARIVNVSYTLPFCLPAAFAALWEQLTAAIAPGGYFAGQMFGDRDSWAGLPDRTHHTRAQVDALLAGFDVLSLREEEKTGKDLEQNTKHWHVFHIVARKPGR